MNDLSLRTETTVCYGAVCEILGRLLDLQAHGDDAAANPYFTPEDFEQLRVLQTRVADLRERAGCVDFLDATVALLEGATTIAARVIEDFQEVFSSWEQVDGAYRDTVRRLAKLLRAEFALLERHPRTGRDSLAVRQQVDSFCLADTGGGRARPAPIDLATLESFRPDPERIRQGLAPVKAALDRLLSTSQELTARSAALVSPAIEKLTTSRLLLRQTDTGAPVIDLGSFAAHGQRYAFLEFRKPPALKNFTIDEGLALFLNVAEDVAVGHLRIADSAPIVEAYNAFLATVTRADGLIADAASFGRRLGERMASATEIFRLLEKHLDHGRIQQAAAGLRDDVRTAGKMLERALQLVQIGELSLGTQLAEQAVQRAERLLDARALETVAEEQRSKLAIAQRSFASLQQEGSRQPKGWRAALGEAFFLNSRDELLRRLESFYRHHASTRVGPGTELGRKHGALIRGTNDYCLMLEHRPALQAWFVIQDALERVVARPVSAAAAFFNALCAIASAHASIDEAEEKVIYQAALDAELAIDQGEMRAAIAEWRSVVSGKRLVAAVAQTVADVDAITDPEMLERLNAALKNVARADDAVVETEIAVYHALLARIAQRMYSDPSASFPSPVVR